MNNQGLNVDTKENDFNAGLERDARLELSTQLSHVLAYSYALYGETQGVHWNVTGPLFYSVHKLTEEQYTDLAESIDEIAERIRALGFKAPAGLRAMAELSFVNSDVDYTNAGEMLEALVRDSETVSRKIRGVVELAEKAGDVKTADLLTHRIGQLEENAWMLRALAAS